MRRANTTDQVMSGEKTIQLKIRFFTDSIARREGEIVPRHALEVGMVSAGANLTHGITSLGSRAFHSLTELPSAVQ